MFICCHCSNARRRLVFLAAVILIMLQHPMANSQIPNINSLTADTAVPKPGSGHSVIQMLSEAVNPASGGVSLTIAFPTPPGRGLSPTYKLLYNSSSAYHLTSAPFGSLNFTPTPSI